MSDLSLTVPTDDPASLREPRKRVLIVTTAFPPNGSAGRFRPLKLLRLLPQRGWDVAILTTSPEIGADARINSEIPPNSRVVRAWLPQVRDRLIAFAKGWAGERESRSANGGTTVSSSSQLPAWRRALRLISTWSAALGRYCMIPDIYMPWIPFAFVKGLRLCRRWRPTVVLTTAPTFSTFIVGYALKAFTRTPWVADYRDLWSGDVLRQSIPPLRATLELRLERFLLRRADVILAVSEGYRHRLLSLHQERNPDRIRCVPNGTDCVSMGTDRDVLDVTPQAGTFVYTGSLYETRSPLEFFTAFMRLAASQPPASPAPKCILAGQIQPQVRAALEEVVGPTSSERSPFLLSGQLTHTESIRLQRSAFALLLFVNRGPTTGGTVPGKLYEYIAARRPILVVTDGGDAAQIVRRGRLGWVTKPDPDAIYALLRAILADPDDSLREAYQPDWEYLSQFDEGIMAARIADALTAASQASS